MITCIPEINVFYFMVKAYLQVCAMEVKSKMFFFPIFPLFLFSTILHLSIRSLYCGIIVGSGNDFLLNFYNYFLQTKQ